MARSGGSVSYSPRSFSNSILSCGEGKGEEGGPLAGEISNVCPPTEDPAKAVTLSSELGQLSIRCGRLTHYPLSD